MSDLAVFQNSSTAFSSAMINPTTQSLYTYILGFLTVFIAYQQYKANKYRIKIDLYERRLRVYNVTREILHSALSSSKIKQEQFKAFEDCIAESRFIFKPDVHSHLNALSTRLHSFQDTQSDEDTNYETLNLNDKQSYILSEISSLSTRFSHYLSLRSL